MTQVYDLSDPAHPVKISDFGLPGQEPGSTGAVPTEVHGPISTGPARQPRLFRLRHRQGRLRADRRPRQAAQRTEGADARKICASRNFAAADVGLQRRPHHLSDAGHADRGICKGQGRPDPRHRHDRRRGDPERMPRAAADGVVRRRHRREPPDDDVELYGAGGERHFCDAAAGSARTPPTRAWRQSITRRWCSSRSSMPACARSTSAIPITRTRSAITFRRSRRRPTSAASRSTARSAARSRSRPTMSRPTIAAISTSSIAPTPACIFWN